MINGFKQYLEEQSSVGYLVFGRFNPPTTGHEKLLDKLAKTARGKDYFIFTSQSSDPKKNPLDYQTKVKFMRKMFPKHARNIIMDKSAKMWYDAVMHIYNKGFKNLVMVVGSDRVQRFENLLNEYNGKKAKHGMYKFDTIKVVSAGARDPDSDDVSGVSASKQRENAKKNDFRQFSMGLPKGTSDSLAKDLFNAVRKGMNLNENKSFAQHVMLAPVSETRESYVSGELYAVGSSVRLKESEEVGIVRHRGSNYLIVEFNGNKKRVWLDAVEEAQDPDIKDRKGSQPAAYHKGLSKSTKIKRDAQFKKQAKMADDDPKAYKPAPGDKSAKTKPSKHTLKFKQMYGEAHAYL